MKFLKIFVTVIVIFAVIIPVTNAGRLFSDSKKRFKPNIKFSVGMSYRTDEHDAFKHTPTAHLVLYGYLFPGLAMKIGSGINLSTEYEYRYGTITQYHYESGFRFQFNHKDISPYVELGVSVIDYSDNSYNLDETRVGLGMALGGEIKLSQTTFLDLSLRHIANKRENYDFIGCPSCEIYYPYYYPNEQIFNPTTIKAAVNFVL